MDLIVTKVWQPCIHSHFLFYSSAFVWAYLQERERETDRQRDREGWNRQFKIDPTVVKELPVFHCHTHSFTHLCSCMHKHTQAHSSHVCQNLLLCKDVCSRPALSKSAVNWQWQKGWRWGQYGHVSLPCGPSPSCSWPHDCCSSSDHRPYKNSLLWLNGLWLDPRSHSSQLPSPKVMCMWR